MKTPMIYTAKEVRDWSVDTEMHDGRWIPSRPLSLSMYGPLWRWKLAWRVLTGRYDALDWEDSNG